MNILRSFNNGLYLGCAISVTGTGEVIPDQGGLSITNGEVNPVAKPVSINSEDIITPSATEEALKEEPAKKEGEEEEAEKGEKEAAKKEGEEEEAPEEKPWAERDKAKDVPLTEEQVAKIAAMATLTDEQKAAVTEFTLEMNTRGDLSEEGRNQAAKLWGVDRGMVDAYVEGIKAQNALNAGKATEAAASEEAKLTAEQQAQFDLRMTALYEVAGSKDNYDAFAKWATAGGVPEADLLELANAIEASPKAGALMLKEHFAAFQAQGGASGGPKKDLSKGASPALKPAEKVQGFASSDEQNAAIRDPRYAKDEQYRMEVDARIVATSFKSGAMM